MTRNEYREFLTVFFDNTTENEIINKFSTVSHFENIEQTIKLAAQFNTPMCCSQLTDDIVDFVICDALKLNIEFLSEWLSNDRYPDEVEMLYDNLSNTGVICYPDGHMERCDRISFILEKNKTDLGFNVKSACAQLNSNEIGLHIINDGDEIESVVLDDDEMYI